MRKQRKKFILSMLGITGLSMFGKAIYEFKKEDPKQSKESWLQQKLFALFSKPLTLVESESFYKKAIQLIGKTNKNYVRMPDVKSVEISELLINDMQTIVLNNKRDINQKVIFFLHGGGYLAQPAPLHYNLATELIEYTDAKIVMPIYPKAPHYDFKDAYPKLLEAYRLGLEYTGTFENVTVLGDSAGGGLALGLSNLLAEKDLTQPKQLILISPWLDASSENPEMKHYEDSDTLLPSQFYFKATGRLWASGEQNIYHPLVSPMYSDNLSNLPPAYIIAGEDEMFYPDIKRFYDLMIRKNKAVKLFVKENMIHDYVIFDTPESKETRKLISQLI